MDYERIKLADEVASHWEDAVIAKKLADAYVRSKGHESSPFMQRYVKAWEDYQKANTALFLYDVDN